MEHCHPRLPLKSTEKNRHFHNVIQMKNGLTFSLEVSFLSQLPLQKSLNNSAPN